MQLNLKKSYQMKTTRIASIALAAFLHVAPFAAKSVQSLPGLAASPIAIVLKWVIGAFALGGAYHTVSAATAVLASSSSATGKVGTRMSYQIKISDGKNRAPGSWVISGTTFSSSTGSTTVGMPSGLSLALATGIISGIPTRAGTFPVTITAYEERSLRGAKLTFTVTFTIEGDVVAPAVVTAPQSLAVHPGESARFTVAASGSTPLAYQWKLNGTDIQGASSATLTLNAVGEADLGNYSVVVSNAGGSSTSSAAELTIVPLELESIRENSGGVAIFLRTIPGRRYLIEAAQDLGRTWETVAEKTAAGDSTSYNEPAPTQSTRFWKYRAAP